ncbi:hypothetical protein [Deinococcus multiflagellatus]|uniref:Uncharacterized protein n=1 Tax=Deinococcus multiflagellatus TaxID=1656887 RepID=A0ABW1ZVB8_9DEIO|nr:hypothetical protein [Deinococcus multiflagellatus]MBZ9714423.1 hypothetical protein [Deinococcus multiflagellatus]
MTTEPKPPRRNQTSMYVNVNRARQLASAVIVQGNSALTYDLPLISDAPEQEVLIALIQRCRAGEQIHVYSSQSAVADAVRQNPPALRAAVARRHANLQHKRAHGAKAALWQRALHFQVTGQLDALNTDPNVVNLHVSCLTDGRHVYTCAALQGLNTLKLYTHTDTHHDLIASDLGAVVWGLKQAPSASHVNIHLSHPATAKLLMELEQRLAAQDPYATGPAVTAIRQQVSDLRLRPRIEALPAPGQPLPAISSLARLGAATLL